MDYDDLVRCAGLYNDGHITALEFRNYAAVWITRVAEDELDIFAGALLEAFVND